MPSNVDWGIRRGASSIAEAIRARRARTRDEEATRAIINAILAGQQLTNTGTLDPAMAAQVAELGVDVGGVGGPGDVTRTNEQTLSSIISAVANKYPTLAGQNLQALMAPQQQLVQERQARSTLEGFSPMVSSVLSPEQMQATIAAGNVDPVAMAEMYKNWTNTLITNQAGTEGQQLAKLGSSGEKLRGQEMEDYKERTKFSGEVQFDVQSRLNAQQEGIQKRLIDYRASLEKDKTKELNSAQRKDVFSAIDANREALESIETQKNEMRKIKDSTITTTETTDALKLGKQVFPGVSVGRILEDSKVATLLGENGYESIKTKLTSEGLMPPTIDAEKKLAETLESFGGATSKDPGSSFVLTPQTIQNIDKRAQAEAAIIRLDAQKERVTKAATSFIQDARSVINDPVDLQLYNRKAKEAEAYLGVSLQPAPTSEFVNVSGVPSEFAPGKAGKTLQKMGETLGVISDAVGEDVSSVGKFLGGKAPENIAGVKTGTPARDPRRELLDSVQKDILEATTKMDVVTTINNIDSALGDKKMTEAEKINIREIIKRRNDEIEGGLK